MPETDDESGFVAELAAVERRLTTISREWDEVIEHLDRLDAFITERHPGRMTGNLRVVGERLASVAAKLRTISARIVSWADEVDHAQAAATPDLRTEA